MRNIAKINETDRKALFHNTAAKMGIPTVSHEQNAFPGLTTKALCAKVDKMLLATEAAQKHLRIQPLLMQSRMRIHQQMYLQTEMKKSAQTASNPLWQSPKNSTKTQ